MFRVWGLTRKVVERGDYDINFHKIDVSHHLLTKYFITVNFGHHGTEIIEFDHKELGQFTEFLKEVLKLKGHIEDDDLYNKLFTVDGEMSRSCLDVVSPHQSAPYIRDLCAYKLQSGEYYKVVLSE